MGVLWSSQSWLSIHLLLHLSSQVYRLTAYPVQGHLEPIPGTHRTQGKHENRHWMSSLHLWLCQTTEHHGTQSIFTYKTFLNAIKSNTMQFAAGKGWFYWRAPTWCCSSFHQFLCHMSLFAILPGENHSVSQNSSSQTQIDCKNTVNQ